MTEQMVYRRYSDFLKEKYKEKVYKLPVNLPVSCPNRIYGAGCSFCAEAGTGFEAMENTVSVTKQLETTKKRIAEKYKAKKFIAYFQNYTNTFLEVTQFRDYMCEAAKISDIVEIAVSTRPDCVQKPYLEVLKEIQEEFHLAIHIELGLQTVNYHTLDLIDRGHGLAEYLDAVAQIRAYDFTICTHLILNLPNDTLRDTIETAKIMSALRMDVVKLHSLYIAKNTKMGRQYEDGTITPGTKEEYFQRLQAFLEYLSPEIVVERLFSRIPEKDAVFSNWGTSWWKLQDEFLEKMRREHSFQGKKCSYLNGCALQFLK